MHIHRSGYTPLHNSVDDGRGKEGIPAPDLPYRFHASPCAWNASRKAVSSHVSTHSPAEIAVEYENIVLNAYGSSEYRGPPNKEVDTLWNRFTYRLPLRLTEKEMLDAGIQLRPSLVAFHEEDGGGYMASLDVIHQLHCLDTLRKLTYTSYYEPFDKLFRGDAESIRHHTDHCIEALRQRLMCASDIEVVAYDWINNVPKANFTTQRTCRNFDKIYAWYSQHEVLVPKSHMSPVGDEGVLSKVN